MTHQVENAEHAFIVGLVHGHLLARQVDIWPEFDEEGNYLASMVLTLPEPALGTKVRIVVEQMEQS